MARWRDRPSPFPSPLDEFREEEWPPVAGECLGVYGCLGAGYSADCAPRPGEFCGELCYATLAPERLAAWKRADAMIRWRQARVSWAWGEYGEGHPVYTAEWVASLGGECDVRYGAVSRGRGAPSASGAGA